MISAPLPPRIIEKCLASDQIVIDTIISKYRDHIPLYRQSAILERDTGLQLSRATLDGWVLKVGELLVPMVAAMRRELIGGTWYLRFAELHSTLLTLLAGADLLASALLKAGRFNMR